MAGRTEAGRSATPLSKCLEIRQALADAEPANDRRQLDLMLVLARSGKVDDANQIIRKYAAQSNADNEMLLELARALAQCSQRTTDSEAAAKFATDAIAQIEKAIAADFTDAVLLKGEPDLAPSGLTQISQLCWRRSIHVDFQGCSGYFRRCSDSGFLSARRYSV